MKRLIISVVLALSLLIVPVSGALAVSSQDVEVTADPIYVSISNTPTSEALGLVAENSTTWAIGPAPADPLVDAGCTFTVTNDGEVAVNINIQATDFTGGLGWTLASTVGEATVVMKAGKLGDAHTAMIVLTTSSEAFISSLATTSSMKWEFNLQTGTFTDGVLKTNAITLTATAV